MAGGVLTTAVFSAMLLAAAAGADELHAPLDALLRRYVDDDGRVAYRNLAQQDTAALDAYLAALAVADPAPFAPPEQLAFWINAYNARVLRGVLDGYRAESFFGRKRFFSFYTFPLAGQSRTLDGIEHEILRKQFRQPRIHFALVCASTSCPKLRREAYRGDRLDAQLDAQTRGFLDDPRRNRFGPGDEVALSPIFKWFGEDFAAAAGSVPEFIRRYHAIPEGARIEYLDYDWTLNAQPGQRPE
jgi:Protein of unknown function, DUF547